MLKSSSELPDESLDSDELSDNASESDSSLELLSSSLETSPSKRVRQQGTGICPGWEMGPQNAQKPKVAGTNVLITPFGGSHLGVPNGTLERERVLGVTGC